MQEVNMNYLQHFHWIKHENQMVMLVLNVFLIQKDIFIVGQEIEWVRKWLQHCYIVMLILDCYADVVSFYKQ